VVARSSGSQLVSTSDVRRELACVGLTPTRIEPVAEQGWASEAFELDGELIVRFPRNDEIAECMQREMRLLPVLAQHLSFRVPVPIHTAERWFVYEKVPGRAFASGDDLDGVRAMIDELHTFPAEVARDLLQRPTWTELFARQWEQFSERALPHLPPDLVDEVTARYVLPASPEVFVHNDLGCEHLLVDDRGAPVGIIDFEDAIVGDPEVDLVPVHAALGLPMTPRMRFYRWVGSLHALVYYADEDPSEIPAVIAELRRRLDSAGER
jgi:aminoglycoside phosphotransferase (APT) family kinase protein